MSVGTQMDLKAIEYSQFIQMNQDLSLNITMGGRRFYRKQIERFHIQCISDVRASDHRCVMVRGAKSTTICSQLVTIRGNVTAQ